MDTAVLAQQLPSEWTSGKKSRLPVVSATCRRAGFATAVQGILADMETASGLSELLALNLGAVLKICHMHAAAAWPE